MTAQPRYKSILADAGLFYAAAVWGSTFFIVKMALAEIDPVILVGYRFTLAGLLVIGGLLYAKRPVLAGFSKGLVLGIILWGLYVPQTIGLGITTASNSAFITGLFVVFVPLFLRIIFKRTPTRWEVIASGVALIGLWILTGGMKEINAGDALTLITAMAYALHLLYADKFMKENIDPYAICGQQFLVVGFLSLLTGLIFKLPFSVGSPSTIGIVVFLTLFPTLSAFIIQMLAQKIAAPLKVSVIFSLEPVFAAVFAWTLGGEEFMLRGAIGGLVIFLALVISGISARRSVR